MNSLRRLRNSLKRSHSKRGKNNQTYFYSTLPNGKLGYIIEQTLPHHQRQYFYYKYRENADGTLTKYGYMIHNDENIGGHKSNYHNHNHNHNNNNHNNNNNNNGNKIIEGNWSNKDKDCIFYQTVADKTQIQLEYRWLNEIRIRGRWEIPSMDYEDMDDEYKEWADIMQHNNKVYISDGIQRRRVAEVLSNVENCCGMDYDLDEKNSSDDDDDDNDNSDDSKDLEIDDKNNNENVNDNDNDNDNIVTSTTSTMTSENDKNDQKNKKHKTTVERRLGLNQLPPLTTAPLLPAIVNQINPTINVNNNNNNNNNKLSPSHHNSPILRPKQAHVNHKSNDSVSTTPLTSLPQHVSKNYIIFTPPLSPQTPPSTPLDSNDSMTATSLQNSLININVRKRGTEKQQLNQQGKGRHENMDYNNKENVHHSKTTNNAISNDERKQKKLIHLIHPKFDRNPPQVRIFDPEDTLLFNDCQCEYCMIGEYNE